MKPLVSILKKVGKPTRIFSSPDGARVLVLPYGGRVLGLFAPGSEENFYLTHSALESVETARACHSICTRNRQAFMSLHFFAFWPKI